MDIILPELAEQVTSSETESTRETMLKWFTTMEHGIQCLVKFVKVLPGFRDLQMDDQLSLLKCNWSYFSN